MAIHIRSWHQLGMLRVAILLGLALAYPGVVHAAPGVPEIKASAAILVDAASGQVLYERNADARRPPASTTKIMTAMLLIEHTPLDETVCASKADSETDGSSLYLLPGECVSAEDLLYAILLRSANDACMVAARTVAGSTPAFVDMMNRKAAEIGTRNTHFTNPNGLHAPGHYTTARDLACIACYALRNERFCEVVRTRWRIIKRDPRNKDIYLKNHNKLLWYYPGADGVKTGYTVPAGRCLVASATRNQWRLVSVVMNSPDMYGETRRLLDYGFGAFRRVMAARPNETLASVPVDGGTSPAVGAVLDSPVYVVLSAADRPNFSLRPIASRLSAPVTRGQPVGRLEVLSGGHVVARAVLRAERPVPRSVPKPAPSGVGWRTVGTIAAVLGYWYVSTRPQDTRRRRHRLSSGLRRPDAGGAGYGQRADSH